MKLEYTSGCICDNITVDDISISYLDNKEKQEILNKCIKVLTVDDLSAFLVFLLEEKGAYKYQYHCDECGDDVYSYILKIKD